MCQECVDACRGIFPEVPDEEMGDFLFGTTCYPAGRGEAVRKQLIGNRARMTTNDYHECYAIADQDTEEAMAKAERDDSTPKRTE